MIELAQSHPGVRFFSILTQYYDYLQLYGQFGFDGILRAPHETQSHGSPPLSLESLQQSLNGCRRCKLHVSRTHMVFGAGNPHAVLMFIGEAPGYHEDKQGEPFVGKAGELLTRILQAIGLRREDVYLANILKCRPPNNRDPQPDEMKTCMPYLMEQIRLIKPKIICALGRISAQALLQTTTPLGKLRGQWHDFNGIPFIVTYHPAALLRFQSYKRDTWEDVKRLRAKYDELMAE